MVSKQLGVETVSTLVAVLAIHLQHGLLNMPVEHILDTECSSQNITDRPSAFLAVLFIQSGIQFKQQRLPDAGMT